MFDTYVTVVGNVLTKPEWRRTSADVMVANFKVASTARRLDRQNGRWVDGNSLRVRVACWRRLAENVVASVGVGDPVIVAGRLYTRDWVDPDGNHRALYELEAATIGHDLSRGRAQFARLKQATATSTVEDDEADARVQGQPTERVPEAQAPVRPGEGLPDVDPDFFTAPVPSSSRDDEFAGLGGGLGGGLDFGPGDDPLGAFTDDADDADEADGPDVPDAAAHHPPAPGAADRDETGDDASEDPVGQPGPTRSRSRRGRSRETVSA